MNPWGERVRKLVMAVFIVASLSACGGVAKARAYEVPCKISSFAESGDGTLIWTACDAPAGGVSGYTIDLRNGQITKIGDGTQIFDIVAAPIGDKAVVVFVRQRAQDRAVLYEGTRAIADLPIQPFAFLWSADGSKIYSDGGSAKNETDAWNIMTVLRISDRTVTKMPLVKFTESMFVCPRSGDVFTGDPLPDDDGMEYDANIQSPKPLKKILPGYFSATCRYVATNDSFHGPTPWDVFDVATGVKLMQFEFIGEEKEDEFEFESWNPQRDELLLRILHAKAQSDAISPDTLQVFDVRQRRVLAAFPNFTGPVEWSKDGKDLIFAKGSKLSFVQALKN